MMTGTSGHLLSAGFHFGEKFSMTLAYEAKVEMKRPTQVWCGGLPTPQRSPLWRLAIGLQQTMLIGRSFGNRK